GIGDVDPPGGVGGAVAETEDALDEAKVRDAVGERLPVGGVDAVLRVGVGLDAELAVAREVLVPGGRLRDHSTVAHLVEGGAGEAAPLAVDRALTRPPCDGALAEARLAGRAVAIGRARRVGRRARARDER